MFAALCVAVAHGSVENVQALLDAGLLLLDSLAPVLFAFQLALRREDRPSEPAFGRVFELEIEAFNARLARIKALPQFDMKHSVTRKALQVIEYDQVLVAALCIAIAQQRYHPGTIHEIAAAADVIRNDGFHIAALSSRICAAAVFLVIQAAAFRFLAGGTHPAVKHRRYVVRCFSYIGCSYVISNIRFVTHRSHRAGREILGISRVFPDFSTTFFERLDCEAKINEADLDRPQAVQKLFFLSEPRRVCRRLQLLNRMERHERDHEQVFP